MDELKELIKVSLSGRVTGIETFNHHTANKKTPTFKLFYHILKGTVKDDSEAKKIIYGNNYRGFKYNMLKERLRERLYTNILFLQPRKRDTRSFAHNVFYCHKYYIVARLLLMVVAKKAGRNLMRKTLLKAQNYEIFEIALLAASALKTQAIEEADMAQYKLYSKLYNQIFAFVNAENEAESLYNDLIINFSASYARRKELLLEEKQSLSTIEYLKQNFISFKINYKYFQVNSFYAELKNDYKTSLQLCKEFENYLQSQKKFYSLVRHSNIIIMQLNCYLYLKEYDAGIMLAQSTINNYEIPEGNRLVLMEVYFLLAIKNKDYNLCIDILSKANFIFKSRNVDERQKEIWRIFNGYIWLCFQITNNGIFNDFIEKNKNINLGKLLNEVPIYSKDKKGLNLSLGILQFTIFIFRREFTKAIDKVPQLEGYIYKYMDREEDSRDFIFLRLIALMAKHNFDVISLQRKTDYLLKKLESTPSHLNAYSRSRIEVIPYENLWKLIILKLS